MIIAHVVSDNFPRLLLVLFGREESLAEAAGNGLGLEVFFILAFCLLLLSEGSTGNLGPEKRDTL